MAALSANIGSKWLKSIWERQFGRKSLMFSHKQGPKPSFGRQMAPLYSYQPWPLNRGHWRADYGMKRLRTAQTRTIRPLGDFDEGLAFQIARGDEPCRLHRGLCRPRVCRKARCARGRQQRL